MKPDVAVVIPTRGRSNLLETTLHGALNQTGVDVEVIVVDDGSTDDTAALLANHDDDRLRVLRNDTPEGVSAARNRGISHARSRWIAFLDDDDLWAPDKLAAQLEAVETAGRAWVYAGDVNVDSDLHVLSGAPPPDPDHVVSSLDRYNAVPAGASNVLVSSDQLERVGLFDPQLHRTEDWDLWIRLARKGPPAWVNRPLVAYHFHGRNADPDTVRIVGEPRVLAGRYGIPVDMAAMHRRAAWSCLLAGRRLRAVGQYGRALARGDLLSGGRAIVALLGAARGTGYFALLKESRKSTPWIHEAEGWLDVLARSGESPNA